jgi:hypothetical protein
MKNVITKVNKNEVLQAHAIQVQTLQNELESLRAQLANLKGKSSQLTNHALLIQGLGSHEGPPRSFYGLSQDAMVAEYVLFQVHTILVLHRNLLLFFALRTSRHKRLVRHLEFLPLGK